MTEILMLFMLLQSIKGTGTAFCFVYYFNTIARYILGLVNMNLYVHVAFSFCLFYVGVELSSVDSLRTEKVG